MEAVMVYIWTAEICFVFCIWSNTSPYLSSLLSLNYYKAVFHHFKVQFSFGATTFDFLRLESVSLLGTLDCVIL